MSNARSFKRSETLFNKQCLSFYKTLVKCPNLNLPSVFLTINGLIRKQREITAPWYFHFKQITSRFLDNQYFLVFAILYGIPIEMDAGTRAFVIAAYSDFFPCIYGPSVLLYAAPVFREKMTSYVTKIKGTLTNCCEMMKWKIIKKKLFFRLFSWVAQNPRKIYNGMENLSLV